jgi:hypothetical protein
MAPRIVRLSLAFGASLVVAGVVMALASSPALGAGRTQTAKAGQMSAMSMTGCLEKGLEAGGYYLADSDGKMWELSARTMKFGKDVGQKVTVTGREIHRAKAIEAKLEGNETKEADGKPHGDLQVTSLKSTGEACGK